MSTKSPTRGITPEGQQGYDVTRMSEEDFERLAVYIVPDMPCDRGTADRAEKTLPRSLTLKPSLVLSTPNVKVSTRGAERRMRRRQLTVRFPQTEGVWSTGVIPRGTRFGPFEGVPTPNYPSDKNAWRYFWRVSLSPLFHSAVCGIRILLTNFQLSPNIYTKQTKGAGNHSR